MKTFKVPVTWTCWGIIPVEAETLEEAVIKSFDQPLPYNTAEYVEDSFEVDLEGVELYNKND